MRPDTGTIWAADGWRLEWDLSGQAPFDDGRMMPDAIEVYGPERLNNNISGTITHRGLERAVAVDDVLDKVRELLKATGITAEMVCIDELRMLMGRVDDGK